ncbi:MAG: hypothetical protein H7122_20665 [Chitinophagaceae bacterium]|nr:hypothetical protein [Chitinophagaceae bacterium]
MKKYFISLAAIVVGATISCKKDNDALQPPDLPAPIDDARTVLLKEVVVQSLPSPYFHFTYDSLKYVTQINFASGFSIYSVEYENKRVKKMTNFITGSSILYSYSNNHVSEINEFSASTGDKKFCYKLFYNSGNQLVQILWFEFFSNSNGELYKKSELACHTDGNLAEIDHHFRTSPGQLSLGKKEKFSNYDNKTNVDDFYLIEDFFDTYLFLPQVKLQRNNPQRQQISGTSNDYDIVYTYDYQNDLPVKRTGMVTQTGRNGGGVQPIQITHMYNYY